MKAVIYVSGGIVQSVHCDNDDFQYKIVDFDNYESEDDETLSEDEVANKIESECDFYEPDEIRPILD